MHWRQSVSYASLTDVGFRRANNQDAYAYQVCSEEDAWRNRGHLFLVADGMGGHAVGELASKLAADTVPHSFYQESEQPIGPALVEALVEANRVIHDRGTHNRDFDRMGTTCTALSLSAEGAWIGHVGDSRCYRIRGGLIEQLTFDHSAQWELVRQGAVKAEDVHLYHPRNVITRCLGPEPAVQADLEGPIPLQAGDKFLICSDGLTGHVADDEIGCIVNCLPPKNAAKLLVNLANLRGGSDNTTVVIVHVGESTETTTMNTPISAPEPTSTSPLVLGGMWGVLAGMAGGISLWILGQKAAGQALLVIAALGFAAWLWVVLKYRQSKKGTLQFAAQQTQGPYRQASARVTRKFLGHLAGIIGELERTAEEEGWVVDSDRVQTLSAGAAEAVQQKKASQAMRMYGDAIDLFMKTIQEQRRIAEREQRYGDSDGSTAG